MLERELLLELEEYIDKHLVRLSFAFSAPIRTVKEEYLFESPNLEEASPESMSTEKISRESLSPESISPESIIPESVPAQSIHLDELEDFDNLEAIDNLQDFVKATRKPAFSKVLFGFIDDREMTDAEVYKRAGIDRRHFSKIRSSDDYRPGKHTVIALALALQLNKKEANQLLRAAGYSLSDSDTFDLVIRFFLEKKIYDILHINEALEYYSLRPLA